METPKQSRSNGLGGILSAAMDEMTCGFPMTISSDLARVIATLNLLGLLRNPNLRNYPYFTLFCICFIYQLLDKLHNFAHFNSEGSSIEHTLRMRTYFLYMLLALLCKTAWKNVQQDQAALDLPQERPQFGFRKGKPYIIQVPLSVIRVKIPGESEKHFISLNSVNVSLENKLSLLYQVRFSFVLEGCEKLRDSSAANCFLLGNLAYDLLPAARDWDTLSSANRKTTRSILASSTSKYKMVVCIPISTGLQHNQMVKVSYGGSTLSSIENASRKPGLGGSIRDNVNESAGLEEKMLTPHSSTWSLVVFSMVIAHLEVVPTRID
ncbi:putative RNA helicase SDE3 [Senna tora]|uniref:Putative RNA helicase SDE3 n=1 Tax=Senna tora TaxID=362788 RepID=A0A834T8X0_9FABA|nr:putative RNA helicase SDE3 [Senna tora]